MHLQILSGGAAQGLVQAVSADFERETSLSVQGTFGAVGAMRDRLLSGEPADLLILTDALIQTLQDAGQVVPGSAVPLGVVRTGIAIRSGCPVPAIANPDDLKAALEAADGIYFPDPRQATAGIHFAKVLTALGISGDSNRLLTFPNGATAMAALATSPLARPIGCTQVTEILNTPGVQLVGLLPKAFELATVYTAAVTTRARHPHLASRLIELMLAPEAKGHRDRLGFEPA